MVYDLGPCLLLQPCSHHLPPPPSLLQHALLLNLSLSLTSLALLPPTLGWRFRLNVSSSKRFFLNPKDWGSQSCTIEPFYFKICFIERQLNCNVLASVCVQIRFSRVLLFATPWTTAPQAPLSLGFSRQGLQCVAIRFSRGSSQPKEWTQVPCTASRFFPI